MTDQNTNSNTRTFVFAFAGGVIAGIVVTNASDYPRQTEAGVVLVMLVVMATILVRMYLEGGK